MPTRRESLRQFQVDAMGTGSPEILCIRLAARRRIRSLYAAVCRRLALPRWKVLLFSNDRLLDRDDAAPVRSLPTSTLLLTRRDAWLGELGELRRHVLHVCATDDGVYTAAATVRAVHVWKRAQYHGALPATPACTGLAFAPRTARLMCTDGSMALQCWDAAALRQLWASPPRYVRLFGTALSAAVCRCVDGTVRLCRLEDGAETARLYVNAAAAALDPQSGDVTVVAASPCGRFLAAPANAGPLCIFDLSTRACVASGAGHAAEVVAAAYSPCGRFVATSALNERVCLWDAATGDRVAVFSQVVWATALVFAGPHRLCAGSLSGDVHIIDVRTGAGETLLHASSAVLALAASCGRVLAGAFRVVAVEIK
jgi:WD40 repeat protein